MSGFRWHSSVVDQGLQPSAAPTAPQKPAEPAAPTLGPAQRRHIENSYSAVMLALKRSKRNGAGKIADPAAVVRAAEAAGVLLGPQGAGTLLAIADTGQAPSLDDYATMCVLTPGTQISSAVAPHIPNGPGLGGLFGGGTTQTKSNSSRQTTTSVSSGGRGGAPTAGRGRGGGAGASRR